LVPKLTGTVGRCTLDGFGAEADWYRGEVYP
jgi:hypothetical protein